MSSIQKEYWATFACGHKQKILFTGKNMLIQQLSSIERNQVKCKKCRLKEFKKSAIAIPMKYGEYKEKYSRKRSVMADGYDKKTGCITVYMTPELAQQYRAEKSRIYVDAENAGINNNGDQMITLIVKGNSFDIKEELKTLGFRFINKLWQKEIVVFPDIADKEGHKYLPPNNNPEFYDLLMKLNALKVKNEIVSLYL